MVRSVALQTVRWVMLASLAVVLSAGPQSSFGADATPGVKRLVAKKGKILRPRLPAHYAEVVSPEQKEAISKIQDEYQPKIEAARAQLNSLTKERNDKVSAVLTAEQKKKVEEAAAKAKEEKEKAKDAKPEAEKPAPAPATPAPATPAPSK